MRTISIDPILGNGQRALVARHVFDVDALLASGADDEGLGLEAAEAMVERILRHIGPVAGDNFWAWSKGVPVADVYMISRGEGSMRRERKREKEMVILYLCSST